MGRATVEPRAGNWRTYWRLGGRRHGAKQSTTWPTEDHAQRAARIAEAHNLNITRDKVYAAILGEDAVAPASTAPTVTEWFDTWLPSKTRITPGVRAGYRSQLDRRILPALGDHHLDELTGVHIGNWINSLRDQGLKNTTITRYYSLLHAGLEAAVAATVIDRNPCKETDFVRDQVDDDDTGDDEPVYLTGAEYALLRAAFRPTDRDVVDVLAFTGARWSEATALTVDDINADMGEVHIRRAWKFGGGGRRYLGPTKGRNRRTQTMPGHLADITRRLIKNQPKTAWLLRRPDGKALHYSNWYHRVWTPALIAAMRCPTHPPANRGARLDNGGQRGVCADHGGVRDDGQPCRARTLPGADRCHTHFGPPTDAVSTCDCPTRLRRRCTPHDLRHSHSAWLWSSGKVSPLAISRDLGHKQLSTTSNIYGGLMPETAGAIAGVLDEVARCLPADPPTSTDPEDG